MSNPTFDIPEGDSPLHRMLRENPGELVWMGMRCHGEYPLVLGEIEGAEAYLCPVCHTIYGDDRKPRGKAFA